MQVCGIIKGVRGREQKAFDELMSVSVPVVVMDQSLSLSLSQQQRYAYYIYDTVRRLDFLTAFKSSLDDCYAIILWPALSSSIH